jgi:aliphatic nitrilase
MSKKVKVAVVQAAPVFMDLNGCIDKAITLIEKAAEEGASLIAFSECWFPGYPWWIWLSPTAHNIKYFEQYHENSLVIGSPEFQRIAQAAKDNEIFVSSGMSERDHGSLYIAQILIDDQGQLLQARRKLKPTHMERTVYGDGDGSDFDVFDTKIGRVGQLCCWEHIQPLSKFAMYSMHEQVHVAAWPSFSTYKEAYALGAHANMAASQVYALEGQCFVLAPCGMVSQEMYDLMVENDSQAELIDVGGGYAQIYAPDGSPMCERLAHDEEGILFAELNFTAITIAKSFADPVGHYSRPDVLKLMLNRKHQKPVESSFDASFEEDSDVEQVIEIGDLDS